MAVEIAIKSRIKDLIAVGRPLSPVGKQGSSPTFEQLHLIPGWLASSHHIIDQVFEKYAVNAYTTGASWIGTQFQMIAFTTPEANIRKCLCAGEMVSLLEALLVDIEHGLIGSLADKIKAETFDDFLDHAEAYHKQGHKFAGVMAGVVFEDTIKRISSKHSVPAPNVEDAIVNLVKGDILTETKAKRARAAASVRTQATHARWDEFDLRDVSDAIKFTRELISDYLDRGA